MTMDFHTENGVYSGIVDSEKLVAVLNAVGKLKMAVDEGKIFDPEPGTEQYEQNRDRFIGLFAELLANYEQLVNHLMKTATTSTGGPTDD